MRWRALLLGLLLASCGTPDAREVARAKPTIVSLNPCSDAVLAEIADPAQILALSHYSSDPASSSMDVVRARRFRAVSGSVEEVIALEPDVVVTGNFAPPAMLAAFRDLGQTVVQIPIATSVEESKAQVRTLARIAGQAARGEALLERIDAALADVAPKAGHIPEPALVWQSGGIVPGEQTLIADLLRKTGFAHFSSARGMGQADVLPLEQVLADPPHIILAAGDPRSNEDRMLGHPALDALSGTRRERLDPSLLWCGGPTIVRAAKRLGEVSNAPPP
ncbi:MAG: ABC transporter substrate-binding protein, partial [Novosphingobium sp.]|nr:ABC transporter substrate-binding protein [Novosphingobium sp.]